jgi:hypothetical protein
MKEDDYQMRIHDKALHRAVNLSEQKLPPMSADLNERLMQRWGQQKEATAHHRWLWTAVASVAIVVVCGLTWLLKTSSRTDAQREMNNYVAELVQKFGATCQSLDGSSSGATVYVFREDEQGEVMNYLKRVAMWIDPNDPKAKYVSSSNQMTLELKSETGDDEVWLADRIEGRVFLYHTHVEDENYSAFACYTSFLNQNMQMAYR